MEGKVLTSSAKVDTTFYKCYIPNFKALVLQYLRILKGICKKNPFECQGICFKKNMKWMMIAV